MQQAEAGINFELQKLVNDGVGEDELTKVKNKVEATLVFSEMDIQNKAMNLAFAEHLGDVDGVNSEIQKYAAVSASTLKRVAAETFVETNCSVLYYHSNHSK